VLPRDKYTAIRHEKPRSKGESQRPECKVCKFAANGIITEGFEVGTIHKVCTNPACPVHHPKKVNSSTGDGAQGSREELGSRSLQVQAITVSRDTQPIKQHFESI
jgi:ParB family transcriptional regulator, chromosome partitioning protein